MAEREVVFVFIPEVLYGYDGGTKLNRYSPPGKSFGRTAAFVGRKAFQDGRVRSTHTTKLPTFVLPLSSVLFSGVPPPMDIYQPYMERNV
jgi:hypothetical protein